MTVMVRLLLSLVCLLSLGVHAQDSSTSPTPTQSSQSQSSSTASASLSLSLTTGVSTVTLATTVSGRATQIVTVVPGIVSNVTYTITPSSASSTSSASATPSPSSDPYVLATTVDPAFAVLGVILILTGLPSAFWGHKNRWTSFFLIGFYSLSLVCIVLILKFGVLPAVHPPSKTVRGMFVLSSTIAGFAGGAIAIFFWKAARYGIGAWGGFAFALWLQCFRNGGVIRPIGYRWILYIACGVIGFMLATLPKIHYHIVLISTAIVGASSFMLGVDCFTTAGLKEFYIWNLGFPTLFPKYSENGIQFPVTQQMQIELGLIGAISLMGMAVQLRVLKMLQRKLREIKEETRRADEEMEGRAAEKMREVEREKEGWERDHSGIGVGGERVFGEKGWQMDSIGHGRQESQLSAVPLLGKFMDDEDKEKEKRRRNVSGLSDFKAAPTSDEDLRRVTRHTSSSPAGGSVASKGALPALDLGFGIEEEVPANYIAKDVSVTPAEVEALKRKHALLSEIQQLRRSIDVLKSETETGTGTPTPTTDVGPDGSRRPSFGSRRTLSFGGGEGLLGLGAGGAAAGAVGSASASLGAHARPPRGMDPTRVGARARVHSLELSSMLYGAGGGIGDPISRPSSVPLKDEKDEGWEKYIQERKLLQPPSGVTPPILGVPSPSAPGGGQTQVDKVPVAPAVQDALARRRVRESVLATGGTASEEEDVPLVRYMQQQQLAQAANTNANGNRPTSVAILPPRRSSGYLAGASSSDPNQTQTQTHIAQPAPVRTRTFEELNERHREKMRDMQAPLTKAEKEYADVEAAKQRWERAKEREKEGARRREKEREERLGKEREKAKGDKEREREGKADRERGEGKHKRSASAEMLGGALAGGGGGVGGGSSSKRLSVMKVEDWQRYQQQEGGGRGGGGVGEMGQRVRSMSPGGFGSGKRDSRVPVGSVGAGGVPFPNESRRKSRDYLS